ncbi:hypothetical protein HY994_04425 [Candidatus Micrarchaeota archaeon]|nr:hypothetical protein [Candidatus Micrarchaeota archaeon]
MAELKLAFDAVKRGVNWFVLSAYSGGKLACQLQVRILKQQAVLLPYPKAPYASKAGFKGKGIGAALVAYAVGFARKQDVQKVVFANFDDAALARRLAGPGRVQDYFEFRYPENPERFQIIWD